jgi:hypothetical protein
LKARPAALLPLGTAALALPLGTVTAELLRLREAEAVAGRAAALLRRVIPRSGCRLGGCRAPGCRTGCRADDCRADNCRAADGCRADRCRADGCRSRPSISSISCASAGCRDCRENNPGCSAGCRAAGSGPLVPPLAECGRSRPAGLVRPCLPAAADAAEYETLCMCMGGLPADRLEDRRVRLAEPELAGAPAVGVHGEPCALRMLRSDTGIR